METCITRNSTDPCNTLKHGGARRVTPEDASTSRRRKSLPRHAHRPLRALGSTCVIRTRVFRSNAARDGGGARGRPVPSGGGLGAHRQDTPAVQVSNPRRIHRAASRLPGLRQDGQATATAHWPQPAPGPWPGRAPIPTAPLASAPSGSPPAPPGRLAVLSPPLLSVRAKPVPGWGCCRSRETVNLSTILTARKNLCTTSPAPAAKGNDYAPRAWR